MIPESKDSVQQNSKPYLGSCLYTFWIISSKEISTLQKAHSLSITNYPKGKAETYKTPIEKSSFTMLTPSLSRRYCEEMEK